MAQTKRGFITLTDINDGTKGIDGADGTNGFAVAQLSVYIRASSTPSTPTGGSYNFVSNALTAPSGWSNVAPSGSDPVYQTVSNVQSDAGGTGTKTPTWGSPAKLVEDGTDGATGGDGTSGTSVYTANVFRRESSAPSTPTADDGAFNFTTNTLTAPSGWLGTVPAGSDPLYVSTGSFSIAGDTGTDNTVTWTSPVIQSQDGSDGSAGGDGLSTYLFSVFRRESSAPSTPTGGSYNFGSNTPTAPSGWGTSVPAGTDPLYTTSALASVTGSTATDSSLTWVTPVIQAENGADGAAGAPGSFERTVYRNVAETVPATTPATPLAGTDTVPPTDWSFIPADSENQRWKSFARFGDGREVDAKEVSVITFGGETGGAAGDLAVAEITTIGITGTKSAPAAAAATVEKTSITFAGTTGDESLGGGFEGKSSGNTAQIFDADFGLIDGDTNQKVYVVVGSSGTVATSGNPAESDWVRNTISGTAGSLRGVAFGNNIWVAAGTGGNRIFTATNPKGAWSGPQTAATGLTGDAWLDIGFGDGKFVAVSSAGNIMSSTDGASWEAETVPAGNSTLTGVHFANGFYVVVAQGGRIITSPAGTTPGNMVWENRSTSGDNLNGVSFGGGLWVAAGGTPNAGNIRTATNPEGTWATVSTTSTGVDKILTDVAYLGGTWLASSSNNQHITSTDGASWNTAVGWDVSFTGDTYSAQFLNDTLIVTGEGGTIINSTRGDADSSILIIDGDNRHFPSGPVPLALGSLSGQDLMATIVRTAIDDAKVAGTITDLTVLPVETGTENVVELDSSNGGAFVTIFVSITAGPDSTATASAVTTTEGAGTGGSTNEQTQLTFSNVTSNLFSSFLDRAPSTQTQALKNSAFGQDSSGDDIYVTVGEPASGNGAAIIYTATDPTDQSSWTKNTTSRASVDAKTLEDVAYDGNGTWMAVANGGNIITTTDPAGSWSELEGHGITSNLLAVRFERGVWLVTGTGVYTATPTTVTNEGAWSLEDGSSGGFFHFALEFDDDSGVFVATGNSGKIIRSEVPAGLITPGMMSWKAQTSPFTSRNRAVTYGDNTWVVVGDGGQVAISVNGGKAWNPKTSGTGERLNGATFAGGTFFAVGNNATIRVSINGGESWGAGGTSNATSTLPLLGASFQNNQLILVGGISNNDGLILTPTGTSSILTISGDTSEFGITGSLELILNSLADGDAMARQVAAFLNTDATGLSSFAKGNVTQVDSTTIGSRTPSISASISVSGGVAVTRQQQGLNPSSAAASIFTITAASATHSPSTFTGTFGSEVLLATALATVKTAFTDGSIGGYNVGATTGTPTDSSFPITSTTDGAETDLTFVITSGTGGSLVGSAVVEDEDQGKDAVLVTSDTWEVIINGTSYTGTFDATSNAASQAAQIRDIIDPQP